MSACIDVYDGDCEARVHDERLVRARKGHKCTECRETIKPGALYERVRGLWEDRGWSEFKTCARCVNIRRDYFRTWFYGFMVEHFKETHGFDYRDGLPEGFGPCQQGVER